MADLQSRRDFLRQELITTLTRDEALTIVPPGVIPSEFPAVTVDLGATGRRGAEADEGEELRILETVFFVAVADQVGADADALERRDLDQVMDAHIDRITAALMAYPGGGVYVSDHGFTVMTTRIVVDTENSAPDEAAGKGDVLITGRIIYTEAW